VIDLVETDEQSALAAAAADFLDKVSVTEPDQEQAWSGAIAQGWLAIGVPEALGGIGYGLAEQALLFRELGRYLSPLPVLESVLAITAVLIARSRDEGLLRDLMAGSLRPHIAQPSQSGPRAGRDQSSPRGQGAQPDRAAELVIWERDEPADHVLILTPGGVDLVPSGRLRLGSARETLEPLYRMRLARWYGAGSLVHGPAPVAAGLRAHALVLTAALLSGIAAQAGNASVQYASQRVQYGRPIGAFQAIKHRCADMAVRGEAAWCITALAALGVRHDTPDGSADAYAARIVAADAALRNARDNIQNHGAIGFTAELAAHRLLKRAHVLDALLVTSPEAKTALLAEDSSR
jgi:alkylation response protein AidB-like acyl-CoA dehydrogenase